MRPGPRTDWHVVTGGPSSGKSTTVRALAARGYTTTIENARHYIDLQRISGRSTVEIRARQREFQSTVFVMQQRLEAALDPQETVFLDRALPDLLAYYTYLGMDPEPELVAAVARASYRTVFLLDLLPLAPDYARTESEAGQRRIHELLAATYRALPAPVVVVPVMPVPDRVDFMLRNIERARAALPGRRPA